MGSYVGAQIAGQGKVFVAYFALVWFITRVNVHVILEIRWLAESPIADLTLKRPASIMHVHVRLEIARCRETLGAKVTLVRLLLVVCHSVVV